MPGADLDFVLGDGVSAFIEYQGTGRVATLVKRQCPILTACVASHCGKQKRAGLEDPGAFFLGLVQSKAFLNALTPSRYSHFYARDGHATEGCCLLKNCFIFDKRHSLS